MKILDKIMETSIKTMAVLIKIKAFIIKIIATSIKTTVVLTRAPRDASNAVHQTIFKTGATLGGHVSIVVWLTTCQGTVIK